MRNIWRHLVISALALSASTLAGAASAPGAWYRGVTIAYIYSGSAGARVAFKVTSTIDVGTCDSHTEFEMDQNSPYFWTMYALLLSAQRSQSTVNVYTDGTCGTYGVVARDVALGNLPVF